MCEEVIRFLLSIIELAGTIKKLGLSIMADIDNLLNMDQSNNINIDLVNNIPIMGDWRKKWYHTPKYNIFNNGTYCVHYYWYKNQNVGNNVVATCSQYG